MGVGESEITQLLKDSDEIFLNQFKTKEQGKTKSSNRLKSVVLILSLGILVMVFLGYAYMGILWLFILWMVVGKSMFVKKNKNSLFKRYR